VGLARPPCQSRRGRGPHPPEPTRRARRRALPVGSRILPLTLPSGLLRGVPRGRGRGLLIRGLVPPGRSGPPTRYLPACSPSGIRRGGRPPRGRLYAKRPGGDRPTPRGVPRPMIGLETLQGTDWAVRLTPTLPNPMPFLAAPQAAVPPANPGGAPPPEVPSCQAAMALGDPPPFSRETPTRAHPRVSSAAAAARTAILYGQSAHVVPAPDPVVRREPTLILSTLPPPLSQGPPLFRRPPRQTGGPPISVSLDGGGTLQSPPLPSPLPP